MFGDVLRKGRLKLVSLGAPILQIRPWAHPSNYAFLPRSINISSVYAILKIYLSIRTLNVTATATES